jgi:spermidine synthase
LWMSLGGVLGGIFNAIIAPLLFNLVIEYAIALALVCLLRPGSRGGSRTTRIADVALPLAVGAALIWSIIPNDLAEDRIGLTALTAIVAMLGLAWAERPLRYSLWVAALLVATQLYDQRWSDTVFRERSFFGVSRVADSSRNTRRYYHGTTIHGAQSLDLEGRLEPTAYYTRSGPFGDIMKAVNANGARHFAMMGLGVGSSACYGDAEAQWDFFEIDPLVVKIATDPSYFSFLSDCPAASNVVLGDARLQMARMPDRLYDLIAVDTFSSDSIPVHIVTREAVEIYLDKLKTGGLLVFHITNRYVDLEPVLAELAASLGMVGLLRYDETVSDSDRRLYDKFRSRWVVMGRSGDDVGALREQEGWRALGVRPGIGHWTDDVSNVVQVIK